MGGIDRIKKFRSTTSTALAYLDEPILITDPKGVLVYLNPRGEESLELDLNLAIGRNLHEILPNNLSAGLMEGLARMRKSNRSLKFVISGNDRHYSAQMDPILKEDKMTGAIISLRPERDHEMIRHLNRALFQNLLDEIYRPLSQIAMLFSGDPAAATDADKFFQNSQRSILFPPATTESVTGNYTFSSNISRYPRHNNSSR